MKTAEKLIKARGERTKEEVCEALKISMSALNAYEQGKREPRDEVKIKMADYYGKNIAELFLSDDISGLSEEQYEAYILAKHAEKKKQDEAQKALHELSDLCKLINERLAPEHKEPCLELGLALARVMYHAAHGDY